METATKTFPLGETVITSNDPDTSGTNTRTTPDRANPDITHWAPSTQERLARLDGAAPWIFEGVLRAMQNAEECGGSVGDEYFALMQAIVDEASERAANYRALLAESR